MEPVPVLPVYTHPKRIGHFHPSLNMNSYKAGGILMKAANMHKGAKKGKGAGILKAGVKHPGDGKGAKVFPKGKR